MSRPAKLPPSEAEAVLRIQLRRALEASSISQAEAARQLGLSNKHLNQMLTGRAVLTLPRAEQVAGLCDLRIVFGFQHADGDD